MVTRDLAPRRANLLGLGAGEAWETLVLDVSEPGRAHLRVEAAGSRLMVLRQGGEVVLLAAVDDDRGGVEYARTGRFRSPVPPVRTARAAALAAGGTGSGWQARWAHYFATALTGATAGPLHAGRWAICGGDARPSSFLSGLGPAGRWPDILAASASGWIEWLLSGGGDRGRGLGRGLGSGVLPLRDLAGPGDGRVRSYRKQVRDGTLPPVLLWWISGLDCHVILDGHDRLAAAIAEDTDPPLLELHALSEPGTALQTEAVLADHYTATAGMSRPPEALAAASRILADNLRYFQTARARTRAWPLRGGTAAWTGLTRASAPDLLIAAGLAGSSPPAGIDPPRQNGRS